jgi:hypothetical protein
MLPVQVRILHQLGTQTFNASVLSVVPESMTIVNQALISPILRFLTYILDRIDSTKHDQRLFPVDP